MMLKRIILASLLVVGLFGQSAYHRLGYGEIYPVAEPYASSVGTGVIALKDSMRASYHNPAALYGLNRVFFTASLGSGFTAVDNSTINKTRLEHLDFVAPLGSKFGFSVSIQSVADFESDHTATLPDGILTEESSGGIWDYAFGLGYQLNQDISLGLKYHLLHGFLRRQTAFDSDELNELYLIKGNVNGHSLEVGAIANVGQKVTMGLTADLPIQRPALSGSDSLAGTSQSSSFDEELAAWPTTIKLGFVVKPSKRMRYLAGISQQVFPATGFDDAAVFRLPQGWETVPVASVQVSMLRYAADRMSRTWVNRVGWQLGGSIKNYYLTSDQSNYIFEYALLSGINFNLRNGKSLFDISGEFGLRGGEESLPDETFARLKLGVQVNEIWFKKVKRR